MSSLDIFMIVIFCIILFNIYRLLKSNKSAIVTISNEKQLLPILNNTTNNELNKNDLPDNKDLIEGVLQIKKLDKNFLMLSFIDEVKKHFEIIFKSFYDRDINKIKQYLSKGLISKMQTEIDLLNKNKQMISAELIRIKTITVKNIYVSKKIVSIVVEFLSEQTAVIKNLSGKIIKGDDNKIETIKDSWCFTKDFSKKQNSDWILEKTIG